MIRPAIRTVLAALALASLPVIGHAQSAPGAAPYRPIVATFSGQGSMSLPPEEAFNLTDAATIEFWVSAKWQDALDYDPAIMAYSGPLGPRFAFHITGDKSGLGIYAGRNYDVVPFDFSDGRLHYVAITAFGDETDVLIDGEVRATLGFTFPELPTESLTIGSIANYSPFVGEIGQVRFWSAPLEAETLNAFALRPVTTDKPAAHPEIEFLTAMSAFANPETGYFIVVGDGDQEPNITVPSQDFPEPAAPPAP